MTYEEARERAIDLGYTIFATTPGGKWFTAIKDWDHTGQTISLEVTPETERFVLVHMHGTIRITTGDLGSFSSDVHFLRWQRQFMETIEKLVK